MVAHVVEHRGQGDGEGIVGLVRGVGDVGG